MRWKKIFQFFENHVPKKFIHESGKLTGMEFQKVEAVFDKKEIDRWYQQMKSQSSLSVMMC